MPRKFVTDYLQKLSSTATPSNGRTVPIMDQLIARELDGRVLDESKELPSCSPSLVSRIFPHLELPQSHKVFRINRRHRSLREATLHRSKKRIPQSSRVLRPRRHKVPSADKGKRHKSHPEEEKPREGGAPRKGTRAKASNEDSGGGEVLYDSATREWNLHLAGMPGTVDVHFIAENPIDELSCLGPQQPSKSLEPGQAVLVDNHAEAPEETDDTLDRPPCRGAAYDGDTSRDMDYLESNLKGKGRRRGVKKLQTTESRRAAFMNALARALSDDGENLKAEPESPPSSEPLHYFRRWQGTFSTKDLASYEGDPRWKRKPDLVLIEGADIDQDMVTWKVPKAIGEITESTFQNNRTMMKSINTKAFLLLSSQPWCRFVLALSFAAFELVQVHYFDRSGAQTSEPIDYHRQIKETCRIIHAFAHADRHFLGFDPTLRIHFYPSVPVSQRPESIGTVEVDQVIYDIISILWASNGFIGRGTVCFHVRLHNAPPRPADGSYDKFDFVLKDSWVDELLVDHEHAILEHISGLEGVPTLIKAWTVQYDGKDDDTSRYRPAGWVPSDRSRFVRRVHRRLLMTPVGAPFSTFRSKKEFLLGLIQGLESHECPVVTKKSVLHRDISPNNLVFRQAVRTDGLREAMVIDFDYAVYLEEPGIQCPQGTGTLPFASLNVLRQAHRSLKNGGELSVQHEVADDLESFFYLFIWFCILFTGPNGVTKPASGDNSSILHIWGEGALLGLAGVKNAMSSKSEFLYAPNDVIDTEFTPYFADLKKLADEWRQLVKAEDERRANPSSASAPLLTHAKIIKLLHKYADPLDTFDQLLKRGPPSPSSSGPLSKKLRYNSFDSIGTVWQPAKPTLSSP